MRDGSVESDQLHGDYDDADRKGGRSVLVFFVVLCPRAVPHATMYYVYRVSVSVPPWK